MESNPQKYFENLELKLHGILDKIYDRRLDFGNKRVLWELSGCFKGFDIFIKEIFFESQRMYSYYVIRQKKVVIR